VKTSFVRNIALGAALGCASLGTAWAQVKWDMPTGYPASNFHTENVRTFAADVEKATGGKLKITVHDNGSLFKQNEIKRAVQGGQAQIGEILISTYANEDPMFGLDGLPFIATSYADARKLWQVSKPAFEARLAKQGLKLLYSASWPPQGIFSASAINSAADLKGVKWRAYSPITTRVAELVGAQSVTIQPSELSQALATGAVQAFPTTAATGFDIKAWEQVKYFYNANMLLSKNIVIVSQKAFDALDKPTQGAVLKAAAAAEERGWKVSEEKNNWYLEQFKKQGMKVEQPSATLKSDMKKVGDSILNDWLKQTGAEGKQIIDAFHKL
jgi:TRAP-type C4-dicarboxylate transport system substrate-binding protein